MKLPKKIIHSIRTRMVLIFVITTLLMTVTSTFILITSGNVFEKMDDMFSANIAVEEFLMTMEQMDEHLAKYLSTDDSDSLLDYNRTRDVFLEQAHDMFDESSGIYNQDDLILRDIIRMVESYTAKTDAATEKKRMSEADEYIALYTQANEIAAHIKTYTNRLNLSKVGANTAQYMGMTENLSRLNISNVVLIVSVILLNIFVILNMTYKISDPIVKLARSAKEISKGNFDTADIKVSSMDELSVMADTFNAMKHSIRDYITALHDKADTESKLLEQQIENLKMQSLLVDAEIKALQMQINPHFLFNTLNAGVQLAMLEGADRTSAFLDDIAQLFRYNVKSLNRRVKLREEIDSVRAYSNLIDVRFGDTIKFNYSIDCDLLDIDVPPLIIQPLVENATIHGIGNLEQGGTITISLEKDQDCVLVVIEDDGVGMDEQTRQRILRCEEFDNEKSGHTTGIGIANVVQRLRLFFDVDDVLDIVSSPGNGTKMMLKIPYGLALTAEEENITHV